MAEAQFESDPEAARRTVNEAREATSAAIADLRSVVRGIHPPVLADRGLDGAIRALALDMAVPVEVTGGLAGRPPLPIESAVYFAVAECLANSAKHAGHQHAWVELGHDGRLLRVVVGDDGRGGARTVRSGAPACGESCGGWRRSTARWPCPAPTAAPRSSPWRCRAPEPTRPRRGQRPPPRRPDPAARGLRVRRRRARWTTPSSSTGALADPDLDGAVLDVRMPPTFTDEGLRAAIAVRAAAARLPGAGAVAVRRAALRPRAAGQRRRAPSATCSRTGSPTCGSSSTAYAGCWTAAPCWTRRSSPR